MNSNRILNEDRSDNRSNLHYFKSNRSNSTMINQNNAIDSIGWLIDWSNILGSIRSSIDPMILSWSIWLVLNYDQLHIRWNIHCFKFDWSDICITVDRTDALWWIRYSIKPLIVSSLINHLIVSRSVKLMH
jgi:hypothetical protein